MKLDKMTVSTLVLIGGVIAALIIISLLTGVQL